jgi:4-amino-4-deoxy-L-arabinose transferase-like glycosyltransferase
MTRRQITISVLIILLAAVVRLVFLDIKPPHFDEGINGWWCDQMAKQGYYAYDPDNYHGPLHFYVLRVFLLAFGRNLWALRMPTVLVGTLTVGFLFSFTRFFGYRVTALAALAMAISPGFVFYERYAIHETWLVFFLILIFWGFLGWHYRVTPASVWATVLGITGMILTKETYAIHLVAFAAASFLAWIMSKIVRGTHPESPSPIKVPWQTFTIGTLVSWPIFAIGFGLIWFLISHANANAATVAPDEPGEVGAPSFVQGLALCVFLGMAIAIPIAILLSRQASMRSEDEQGSVNFPWLHLFGALLVGYFLIVFFYSGNFLNPRGLLGIFETFKTWTKTGVDSAGHGKPTYDLFSLVPHPLRHFGPLASFSRLKLNWYWVKLMVSYEWFSVLGLLFSLRYLFGGNSALRYLAIYGVGVLFVYSIIPYKTPWCIISIDWPFLFLGAAALAFLWDNLPRFISVVFGLGLLGQLAYKSYALNFVHYDDPKQMYAYVQTFRDYRKFVDPILQKLRSDPAAKQHLRGLILLESYFPIPWVIDEIRDIGYYSEGVDKWPKDLDADFIAVLDTDSQDAEDHLTKKYFVETFRLRDGMDPCKAYFKYDAFKDVFPGRNPEFDPSTRPQE